MCFDAADRIEGLVERTPLVESEVDGARTGSMRACGPAAPSS